MAYTAVNPGDYASGSNVSSTAFGAKVAGDLADHKTRISANVPMTRTVSTATGLTGGGDLSANRTLSPVYGTAANTVAQGNDSRITVTQDGTIGNSALDTRATALELIKNTHGRWYWNPAADLSLLNPGTTGQPPIPFNTVDGNAISGMSISGGIVTITNAGRYCVSSSALLTTTGSTVSTLWAYLIHISGATTYLRNAFQYTNAPASSDMYTPVGSTDITCAAGDTIQIQVAKAVTAAGISLIAAKTTLRQTNLAIHRIG